MQIAMIFFAAVLSGALLWRFPTYRAAGLAGLAVVITVFVTYFIVSEPGSGQDTAITPDELALSEVAIISDPRFITVSGNVQNMSQTASLLEFDLQLDARDCPTPDSPAADCIVIGSDSGVARIAVPPQQMRAFSAVFRLGTLPQISGTLRMDYSIIAARANRMTGG